MRWVLRTAKVWQRNLQDDLSEAQTPASRLRIGTSVTLYALGRTPRMTPLSLQKRNRFNKCERPL
jgi:hypothetical protein